MLGARQVVAILALMLAAVALVTFVMLARAFRSLLLSLKAIVLNLLSIGAAYGVLVLVWQQGHGSQAVWGIPATGAIAIWVPLMAFAFLFGLSMDYEVFLLSRMREEYDATGSTRAAVVQGLGRVGRLVTSAALILFLAFASLAAVPEVDVKIMATALGAGILLDATVLRALLVPALVALLGGEEQGYSYARYDNPTVRAFEEARRREFMLVPENRSQALRNDPVGGQPAGK